MHSTHTPGVSGGIRLRRFNQIIAWFSVAASLLLLFAAARTLSSYSEVQRDMERYIRASDAADTLRQASDALTHQVQLYTITGDWQHVEDFMTELNQTRRREQAIADLRAVTDSAEPVEHLEEALRLSNELTGLEYRAMRLTMLAQDALPPDVPEAVQHAPLTEAELALPPEEKLSAARALVFGDAYQHTKNAIYSQVQQCTALFTEMTRGTQIRGADQSMRILMLQQALILLLMVLVLVTVWMTARLIIRPLQRNVQAVQEGRTMDQAGAYEMRFLAQSYNEMYARVQRDTAQLSYEATHDPLTGALNRKAYEMALEQNDEEHIALILVDVDDFKGFNDRFGHDVGDQVLCRVVAALRACFRSEDAVCRIGGDEFAVLMMHTGEALRALVQRKVTDLADSLREEKDGVPGLTLSIGIAFGDRPCPSGTLFQDADRALYAIKEAGRNGNRIYDAALAGGPKAASLKEVKG